MPIINSRGLLIVDQVPNLITEISTTSASPLAYNTVNKTFYKFDVSQSVGSRWIALPGTGTVTNVSVATAAGVSGSVSTSTTTPEITISLGAITPASVAATGTVSGSNLSGTNTGDNAPNSLYSGLVSNATHTGDATGATALTVRGINNVILSTLATGLLKNTTSTGVPTIAVPGTDYLTPTGSAAGLTSFPTLNQNTTGSAATLTTGRTIGITGDVTYTSPSFNGSANVTAAATVTRIRNANVATLTTTGGLVRYTGTLGSNTFDFDTNTYMYDNATITLTGQATGSGDRTGILVTLDNNSVTGKVLTGYVSGAGTVAATDTILQAIQKLNGNIGAVVGGVSSVFGRTGAVVATSGDYNTLQVTENTNLYFTNARARTAISLTTTGASGASTYNNSTGVLNVPTYTLAGLGGLPIAGGTMTGTLTLFADPTNALDAATKGYVDNAITGITWKNSVKAATTANITLSGTQTIDGIALIANDRVLVKNQSTATQNGIYIVAAGAWSRATDANISAEIWGSAVYVQSGGTVNGGTQWANSNTTSPVIGTDNITFGQVAGAGVYTNGSGLSLTGNVFSLNTTLTGLTSVSSTSFVGALTGNASTATSLVTGRTISGTGEATFTTGAFDGTGNVSGAVTLTNSAVIGKVLTGYVSGSGTVSATDTILQAIQKLNGNTSAVIAGNGIINYIPRFTSSTAIAGISPLFVSGTSIQYNNTTENIILDINGTNILTLNGATKASQRFATANYKYDVGAFLDDGTFIVKRNDGTSTATRLIIDSSGNVGINNPSPSVALDVTGAVKISTRSGTSTTLGGFTSTGQISTPGLSAELEIASGNLKLAQQAATTGNVLAWNGSAWAPTAAASGSVTNVTGTLNRITSTGGSTPQIDISASYVGQASITTLGTIATGTWQGSAIGDSYISSAVTWNTAYNLRLQSGLLSSRPLFGISGRSYYATDNGIEYFDTGSAWVIKAGALSGDITTSANSLVTTLATVNSNVGSFGSATQVGTFTVNAKGLITAASNATITPAGIGAQATLSGTGLVKSTAGTITYITDNSTNWDTAYTDRNKWDGGATGLTASTGRTSLGATTVGSNFFTLTNPSAVTFPRINADNTVSALDAATFRSAIGAGTGAGTVTSITAGTGLSGGVITGSGTIALANTAVGAGTYGTATAIPEITIDAQGRITNAIVNAITYSGAGSNGLLSFTDWNTFNNKISGSGAANPGLTGTGTEMLVADATGILSRQAIPTSGGWTDGGTSVYLTTISDRVGIGTSSPSSTSKLHIADSTVNGSALKIAQTAATGSNYGVYAETSGSATLNVAAYVWAGNATTNYGIYSVMGAAAGNYFIASTGTAKSYFNGNIGVGTTTPGEHFSSVTNNNAYGRNISVSNTNAGTSALAGILFKDLSGTNKGAIDLVPAGYVNSKLAESLAISTIGSSSIVFNTNVAGIAGALSGDIIFRTAGNTNPGLFISGGTGLDTNYIGINTNSPNAELDVRGAIMVTNRTGATPDKLMGVHNGSGQLAETGLSTELTIVTGALKLAQQAANNGEALLWNTAASKWLPGAVSSGSGTVTSVAALTLGTSGTDLSSSVADSTTTPVITLNVPTASAANRGVLSSADWTSFNNKVSNATHTGDATGSTALTVVGINGQSLAALATGLLKNTTTTGVPTIAIAGTDYLTPTGSAASLTSFPTFNQNTTGSAATLTTGRTIGITGDVTWTSPSFNGSGNVTAAATVTRINGVALSGLATGILKNTTTTGAPSIAIAGTDYQVPLILTTTGSGAATFNGTTLNIPTPAGGWTDGGTSIYQTTLTDNVGIGTSTPGSLFTLEGTMGYKHVAQNITANTTITPTSTYYRLNPNNFNWVVTLAALSVGAVTEGRKLILANVGTVYAMKIKGVASIPREHTLGPLTTKSYTWDNSITAWLEDNESYNGFTTTATAGGTTTLTFASAATQEFTGTSNQTVVLPITYNLFPGFSYTIINNSTGVLTVNSSTPDLLATIPAGGKLTATVMTVSTTNAAAWEAHLSVPTWKIVGTNISQNTLTNNVGIGLSAPLSSLTINGTLAYDYNGTATSLSSSTSITVSKAYYAYAPTADGWTLILNSLGGGFYEARPVVIENTSSLYFMRVKTASGTLEYVIPPNSTKTFIWSGTTTAWILAGSGITSDSIQFVIDGGGSAITAGVKGDLEIPSDFYITHVTMLADTTGSIIVDLWSDTYANYPPTVADTVCGSSFPTISSATKSTNSTFTGWVTRTLLRGNTLRYNVNSAATITRCTISLRGYKL